MDVITALSGGALENIFVFGVMLIVTLGIVIIIHEWGHYAAAKLCGVRVEQFAFGFGREVLGYDRGPGTTRFSLRLVPLGGYVKLFGDINHENPLIWDHEKNEARPLTKDEQKVAYYAKSVWKRLFIVSAGPLINLILTLLLFVGLFTTVGQRSSIPVINTIAVNSAAYDAGIQIGDKMLAMDGKRLRRLADIYDYTWNENPPKPHTYTIIRNGRQMDITFTAKWVEYENEKGIALRHGQTGMVRLGGLSFKDGIYAVDGMNTQDDPDKARALIKERFDKQIEIKIPFEGWKEKTAHPFLVLFPSNHNQHLFNPDHKYYDRAFFLDPEANDYFVNLGMIEALQRTVMLLKDGLVVTYKTVEAGIKGRNDDPIFSGVGTVSKNIGRAVKAGLYDYVAILAVFSFMIGFMNLLPIPALDGGHIVFLFYEIIRGKPLPSRIQTIAIITGLVLLAGIMLLANARDLYSLLSSGHSG